jgi:hypothetical protein
MGSKRITALVEFEKTRVILYRFTIIFSRLSSIILLASPVFSVNLVVELKVILKRFTVFDTKEGSLKSRGNGRKKNPEYLG